MASSHGLRNADAFQSRRNCRGPTARLRGGEVLDTEKVQRYRAAQEKDQPDSRSYREEGKRSLARQSQAIDRAARKPTGCIHIGDRESDIYESGLAQELAAHFLVRACVDRLVGDGGHTIATEMEETSVNGLHYIDVRDDKGEMTKAALEIKFKRIAAVPPIGKQKRYPALDLTIIHATERGTPKAVNQLNGSS